jgi:hypothetical protein
MLGRWTWLFVGVGILSIPFAQSLPREPYDVLGSALIGNVQILIAAGIVWSMRGHALGWLPGLLTKVVSGLGLGWYVFRGEWRPLTWALGAAGAVAAVSVIISPGQWVEWCAWIINHADATAPVMMEPVPFALRLPMSLTLLLWGARTNRAWVVPIAVGWGTPALYLGTYPSMFIGAIPLALWARLPVGETGNQLRTSSRTRSSRLLPAGGD